MIIWKEGIGINSSMSFSVQECRLLNDVSRNKVQNNLEMSSQAKDSCMTWNSLEKMMWMQNIYMGSAGDQKSMLK